MRISYRWQQGEKGIQKVINLLQMSLVSLYLRGTKMSCLLQAIQEGGFYLPTYLYNILSLDYSQLLFLHFTLSFEICISVIDYCQLYTLQSSLKYGYQSQLATNCTLQVSYKLVIISSNQGPENKSVRGSQKKLLRDANAIKTLQISF